MFGAFRACGAKLTGLLCLHRPGSPKGVLDCRLMVNSSGSAPFSTDSSDERRMTSQIDRLRLLH
jgi:hypothetical protein